MQETERRPQGDEGSTRAWYGASIEEFVAERSDSIIGRLVTRSSFDIETTQRDAWRIEIEVLREALANIAGTIFLEFDIPRMGRRIDAVLLFPRVILVVEFKVGSETFDRSAREQVWDYALDLKNFHEASHSASIIPILVATEAGSSDPRFTVDADGVYQPVEVHPEGLRGVIDRALKEAAGLAVDPRTWSSAPYRPTPTIIEAARALYAQHSVDAIARSDAGARNLAVTSRRIEELVDKARVEKKKVICFVTGVPGAGKTLVGLNVATRRREKGQPTHAVFLSGNGPLVAVLREALIRDEVLRQSEAGNPLRKGQVAGSVKAFIQNVHHFRDEAIADKGPPDDHVVIFDEAQRAWDQQQTESFMRRKKGLPDFQQSEPEFLISYMDRHLDWAVVVCLVGGGQEINTGEAGIDAWLDAIGSHFPHWQMHISSQLTDSEYAAGRALELVEQRENTLFDDRLHLSVSMRSFRAENMSAFVKAMLDCDTLAAREAFAQLAAKYPIAVTRDLDAAKRWVRLRARGTERYGLVASSKAMRLKPHAIDIRVDVDPVKWFLNGKEDTRSSFYLEDAATEFQVQGLELDWVCVTWDGDLRYNSSGWEYRDFRGWQWTNVKKPENRRYLLNAYRVLLTRARQGMVIFIPPGDRSDHTRMPEFYDASFRYLAELGIPVLQ
jgi:hypothetical protein